MDERKKQVLNAIIKDYIANAEPVGSRVVAKKYDLGVSPATVRNEMSDLEEQGYIEQPHTSAGRIPSDKGYRYYVDHLMEKEALAPAEAQLIRRSLQSQAQEQDQGLDALMRGCVQLLSRLSKYPAMVALPDYSKASLEKIQLIPVAEHQILVVTIASSGIIRHRVIDMPLPLNAEKLAYLETALQQRFHGREISGLSFSYIRQVLHELSFKEHLLDQALDLFEQVLSPQTEQKVFMGGVTNMMAQPEFRDIDKLREIFELFEEESKVKQLLELRPEQQDQERLVSLTIGEEMADAGMKNCSVVVADYFINGEKAGTIGVLGPTRMSYPRTVSLLEVIAEELSASLSHKKNQNS